MRFSPRQVESRREFFRASARYGLLGLVTAIAALAVWPARPAGQRCVNQGICGGCALFPACGLPQALSARRARENG